MSTKIAKNLSLLMLVSLVGANVTFAKGNYDFQQSSPQPAQYQGNYYAADNQGYGQGRQLKGHIITVPAGAQIAAVVSTPISSEYLTIGQPVCLTLGSDFYYNSNLIAPAGSTVNGTVVQVKKATHGTINGNLRLRFTEITTPYGTRIPISAQIRTADGSGLLVGGTKMDSAKGYVKDLAVGSAVGALAGTIMGPLSGGAVGRGAALGTAVGAIGGLGKSAWDKGVDVTIPANSTVELQIDQPITVNPSASSYDY